MDIGKIKSNAKSKHDLFIKDFYPQIDKVTADRRLRIESCSSKVKLISEIFKEIGIIDDYGWDSKGDYKVFTFRKSSVSNNSIQVYIDGVSLLVDSENHKVSDLIGFSFLKKYSTGKKYDISEKTFSWDCFADELIESIHDGIYKKSEVMDIKIKGMFKDPAIND